MTAFLTFTYCAALASHGTAGAVLQRPSDDRPAKSAILGLVAGALGLDREDQAAHAQLDSGLFYACRVEGRSRPLTDFHMAATAPTRKGVAYLTRRDEVLGAERKIVSYREYLQDVSCSIALWFRGDCRWSLEDLAQALRTPVWTPYAGRKSCPLSLPMNPLIVAADDVRGAFLARDAETAGEQEFRKEHQMTFEPVLLAIDADAGEVGTRREMRRDTVMSRTRWQFSLREEAVCPW